MEAENELPGRNITNEVDEVRGRMAKMAETQNRIEEMLHEMRESRSGTNGGSIISEVNAQAPPVSIAMTAPLQFNVGLGFPQGVYTNNEGENYGHQGLVFQVVPPYTAMPIGEGYQAVESAQAGGFTYANPAWEQVLITTHGQPLRIPINPKGSTERERIKDELIRKLQEQVKAL